MNNFCQNSKLWRAQPFRVLNCESAKVQTVKSSSWGHLQVLHLYLENCCSPGSNCKCTSVYSFSSGAETCPFQEKIQVSSWKISLMRETCKSECLYAPILVWSLVWGKADGIFPIVSFASLPGAVGTGFEHVAALQESHACSPATLPCCEGAAIPCWLPRLGWVTDLRSGQMALPHYFGLLEPG